MNFHLLGVPNTRTTDAYPLDGFCRRTWLFADLLKRLGHHVTLYGAVENTAPCDVFVRCLTEEEQTRLTGGVPYQYVPFEASSPLFLQFNLNVVNELRTRKQSGDIIAQIAGSAQMYVSECHPEMPVLEYSIGYRGIAAPFRVYQSHIWRHTVAGYTGVDGGRTCDAVIPPWFPVDEFPQSEPEDYVLYCGRLVASKGLSIACRAAEAAKVPLVVIGHGDPALVTYGEYRGSVSMAQRNELLSKARAVLMPTQYIEPFGNVAAEAQMCGTPVISSDFGGFVESVEHGVSGFRCRTLGEFTEAIRLSDGIDRDAVRARAHRLYSAEAAMVSYWRYFDLLAHVRTEGVDRTAAGLHDVDRSILNEHLYRKEQYAA